jgi:hypothetical protein
MGTDEDSIADANRVIGTTSHEHGTRRVRPGCEPSAEVATDDHGGQGVDRRAHRRVLAQPALQEDEHSVAPVRSLGDTRQGNGVLALSHGNGRGHPGDSC